MDNMKKWLKGICPSIIVDYSSYYCIEKYSVCVGCGRIMNGSKIEIQCVYYTENYHCGFPDIAEPLKLAYILLGGSYANNCINETRISYSNPIIRVC